MEYFSGLRMLLLTAQFPIKPLDGAEEFNKSLSTVLHLWKYNFIAKQIVVPE